MKLPHEQLCGELLFARCLVINGDEEEEGEMMPWFEIYF